MHSRILLLLSFVLVIPTAASAGFLWHPGESSTDVTLDLPNPALGGLSGRANPRAAEYILGFTPPPFEPEPGGESEEPPPNDPVPEPSPGLLVLSGLIALAIRRRAAA